MIGFLCNKKSEKNIIEFFQNMLFINNNHEHFPILVFTISSIDTSYKSVQGTLISKNKNEKIEVELPSIIFNFSVQTEKNNQKKLRKLFEIEHIQLINEVNKFNQLMIMEILQSLQVTRDYVFLNYESPRNQEGMDYSSGYNSENILIMPERGTKFSKIKYLYKSTYDFDNTEDSNLYRSKKMITLRVPELIFEGNKLLFTRCFMQKGENGNWKNLFNSTNINNKDVINRINKRIDKAWPIIINHISSYLPSLGHCYIDFLFDNFENTYFLHLGGWNDNFIKSDQKILSNFYENLYNYIFSLKAKKNN